jgi:DNA-directed RNA polymerase specialized sigma24 family protein
MPVEPTPPPPIPESVPVGADVAARSLFEHWHQRLSSAVRSWLAGRAGGRLDIADELAQRVWLAVWKVIAEGRYDAGRASLSTLIFAVMQNIWRQHAQALGRQRAVGLDHPEADADALAHLDEVHLAERVELVRACLAGDGTGAGAGVANLSPDERLILRLLGEGVSDRTLAERLGVAPSTANARKRAAMDKLRDALERAERAGPHGEEPGKEPPRRTHA